MRRKHPIECRRKKHMRGFLHVRMFNERTLREPADFFQCSGEACWIARKLHTRGISQSLALARNRRLNQPPKKYAQ